MNTFGELRPRGRLLIFGWDCADWAVIEEGWRRGLLSNLRALAAEGERGSIISTIPPTTAPAWTTFLTGVDPGEHGIYGFKRLDAATYRTSTMPGGMRRKPTLLKLADDAGYRTCQVTVPWTYPSEKLRHGVVVPGWDAPDESFASTHPEAMAADLSKIFERAPRKPPGRCGSTEFIARQRANVDLRTNICDYLLYRWDPQIFMTVFPEPDQATHLFWASREVPEVVLEAYELVDSAMGKILSAHRGPNDSVLVVSDHGGGPLDTYVHVGKSLADGGFLRFANEPARHVDLARRLKRSVWYRTPPRLRQVLLRRISKKSRRRLSSTVRQNDVDWGSSIAFPRDDGGGAGMAIDINVEGKFSRGSVSTRRIARGEGESRLVPVAATRPGHGIASVQRRPRRR